MSFILAQRFFHIFPKMLGNLGIQKKMHDNDVVFVVPFPTSYSHYPN